MEYFVLENGKHIIYLTRIKLNFWIRGVFAPDESGCSVWTGSSKHE